MRRLKTLTVGPTIDCDEDRIPRFRVDPNRMPRNVLLSKFWGPYRLLGKHRHNGCWIYFWNP